jgi:alkylation response protein AidB-like acyl-CoA dehydrogenase
MLLVPTSSPGFSVSPVYTLSERTNATYYEDVRVPLDALVGEENRGWYVIMEQLNHERSGIGHSGIVLRYLEETLQWAQQVKTPDGGRLIDQEWVQLNLAKVAAKADYLKVRNWQSAWLQSPGAIDPVASSVGKVFGSEFYCEAYRLLMEVLGQPAYLRAGSPGAMFNGALETLYGQTLTMTFGGGTNEIQRDLSATVGLGMPRSGR